MDLSEAEGWGLCKSPCTSSSDVRVRETRVSLNKYESGS